MHSWTEINRIMSPFWDDHSIATKPDGNGGDCFNWIGLEACAVAIMLPKWSDTWRRYRDHYSELLHLFHKGDGNFCRYPFPTSLGDWWTSDNVMSGDQLSPNIVACDLFDLDDWLHTMESGCRKRNWWMTNTMINNQPGTDKLPDYRPHFRAMFLRAKGKKTAFVEAFDRAEFFNVKLSIPPPCTNVFGRKICLYTQRPLKGDPVNRTIMLLQNQYGHELTSYARDARRVYASKANMNERWRLYWERPGDPHPDFHELFQPILDRMNA